MSAFLVFPYGTPADKVNSDLLYGGLRKPYAVGSVVWTEMRVRPQDRYIVVRMEPRPIFNYNSFTASPEDSTTSGVAVWTKPINDARPIPPTGSLDPVCGGWLWPYERDPRYPHVCPKCGSPAFIGFSHIDCKRGCR